MRVYAGTDPRMPLADLPAYARRVERLGYDGLQLSETIHDALAASLLAAEHTERITIRTSVALAFVRSPTLTAYAAWDLARFSEGRFQLGLGTQIRQNIEDRYAMPWREPVERMSDYLSALHDLYAAFRTGRPVEHHGPHYRITRLQPYFNPGPDADTTPPPTYLGGVNAGICQLAGELADGFVTHPTNSDPRYLDAICRPNLQAGAERAGRSLDRFELVVGTQTITGRTEEEVSAERERQRRLLAFLYSTPAYRRTLELYGWQDVAGELRAMIRDDNWDHLPKLVTDEMIDTLVPTGTYEELPVLLRERFGPRADGVVLSPPAADGDDERFAAVVERVREGVP